jgi:hypothetical protein
MGVNNRQKALIADLKLAPPDLEIGSSIPTTFASLNTLNNYLTTIQLLFLATIYMRIGANLLERPA